MSNLFKSIVACRIKITDYMGNEEEIKVHVDEEADKGGLWGYKADDFRRRIEHSLIDLREEHRARRRQKHEKI